MEEYTSQISRYVYFKIDEDNNLIPSNEDNDTKVKVNINNAQINFNKDQHDNNESELTAENFHKYYHTIDDIILSYKIGAFYIILFTNTILSVLTYNSQYLILPFIIEPLKREFMITDKHVAIIFLLEKVGLIIGKLLIAPLVDKYGRMKCFMPVTICLVSSGLLCVMSTNWVTFLVCRVFVNLFATCLMVVDHIYLQEMMNKDLRQSSVGYIYIFESIVTMLLIILFAHLSNNWRLLCLVILVPGVITCILRLFMVESFKFNYNVNPHECAEAMTYVSRFQGDKFRVAYCEQWQIISKFNMVYENHMAITVINKDTNIDSSCNLYYIHEHDIESRFTMTVTIWDLMQQVKYILTDYEYAWQNKLMLIMHVFVGLSFFPLLFGYIKIYLTDHHFISDHHLKFLLQYSSLICVGVMILTVVLMNYVQKKYMLRMTWLVMMISSGLLINLKYFDLNSYNIAILFGLCFGAGRGISLIVTLIKPEYVPTNVRTIFFSMNYMLLNFSSMLGNVLYFYLFASDKYKVLMINLVVLLPSILVIEMIISSFKRKDDSALPNS